MQIITPDIGVDQAQVIEILVKVGDQIAENDSILVLESDKASVEVPSTASGTVKSISVNVGDTVKEGTLLIELEAGESSQANETSDTKAEATPESFSVLDKTETVPVKKYSLKISYLEK